MRQIASEHCVDWLSAYDSDRDDFSPNEEVLACFKNESPQLIEPSEEAHIASSQLPENSLNQWFGLFFNCMQITRRISSGYTQCKFTGIKY